MADTNRVIRRALVSVYDKAGIEILAQAFVEAGTQVVSTGATAKVLKACGVHVTPVEEVTGFPESLSGRVKTLDPHIHAGILADMTDPNQARELTDLAIEPFDLVVVNLYPFADTVRSGANEPSIVEKIDIGGPSMIRGAAKNSASVAVVCDSADYALTAERIKDGTGFSLEERRWLASKAFATTAAYDAAIAQWTKTRWVRPESIQTVNPLNGDDRASEQSNEDEVTFPRHLTHTWERLSVLRYGENPHQKAALYADTFEPDAFAHAEQLGGKQMSYNNYVDADAAWRAVWDFAPQIAVSVCKHNNPCGLAIGQTVAQAHLKAHACDSKSAYGGVIATNATVSLEMAQNIRPIFTEVIVAPDYEPDALELLKAHKKNLRILRVSEPPTGRLQLRQIDGGVLMQSLDRVDAAGDDVANWRLVAGSPADERTMQDLAFAWRAVRCVKSNAVLLANDGATVGIGMGQVNRVDSCHLAIERANTLVDGMDRATGSVAASDAFFPFADGAEALIEAGVKAIVQPGGSIRDTEVIEAAQRYGVTMYLTGERHFCH
ncbi:phosphoribosylaminoimidazolecarboxamide formyltransferase / IMP cyclohydrolase [Bifidobacterium bohemicum]|uniref:Bifunctional purine biosynthesis protein PurH n=1 Tax=Bifidobacterium bohemicum DSM 22767 TaxID=1437606 RepID=A0A086ZJ65_9BIFI|nr:bifunctional phosphoribosylaminoimidazolecarboxamide formyltransferase/IMP cyclohydrolase [Bifidobacterium bohemicum]KFI46565.1 phosphoribosylaminoimidazolecarboxamide formyltransferase [Bifidobacterium bohemicum DSM 22767]SCB75316.1 phosphoribosylaminoimidazolecarboxamide formyltransferase / IMP cyclohydrolase [Bifidobacterium bohemicum]